MAEGAGGRTRTGRTGALLAAIAVAAAVSVVPAAGHVAGAEALTEERTVEGGIVVEAEGGGAIAVDRAQAYRGRLLLHTDGQLVNDVAIEDYVAGIAEMPSRWPMEALKAQAVAARTYAWWHAQRSDGARTDVCATTACQVYRGVEPVEEGGERWARAVAATEGEVLLADGSPLLARYFSTSGGRTFDNAAVFPSTGEQPGLKGIEDPEDAVSPYHRWTVRFERELFDELLARGERLSAAVPVATVERRGAVDDPSARIVVTSVDGTEVAVGAGELRDLLSRVAPDARPDRYPGPAADGLRRLPSTVPTARYDIAIDQEEVVLDGRGWGHGVGMSQYGARGRAASGASYREILAAYYDGAVPTRSEQLPARIRVDLGGAEEVSIGSDRPVTVDRHAPPSGAAEVPLRALGTLVARATGEGWRLEPPDGSDRELEVTATTELDRRSWSEATVVEATVNKPVELHLEVREEDEAGAVVLDRPIAVVAAGTHTATWRHHGSDGEPLARGRYAVALRGRDVTGEVDGAPVEVTLGARSGAGSRGGSMPTLAILAGLALPVGLLLAWITLRRAGT